MGDYYKYREQLILALCEGVPYGLKVAKHYKNHVRTLLGVNIVREQVHFVEPDAQSPGGYFIFDPLHRYNVDVKPFLRPMSSMTEDEKKEWEYICSTSGHDINEGYIIEGLDWLLKHHFDFRGLIEHDLAYEAPEGLYK